jgi:large-conductance mechanosensitive channel
MKKITIIVLIVINLDIIRLWTMDKDEDPVPALITLALAVNFYIIALLIYFLNKLADRKEESKKNKTNSKF